LVDTPERGQSGYLEAINFVQSICGVGTEALVDEDDGRIGGSFGRLIGVVYCGGYFVSLNELLLLGGYAVIDQRYCNESEFSTILPLFGLYNLVVPSSKMAATLHTRMYVYHAIHQT
jgi:hypothetical protein